jgi:DNA-binding CsgD family transcriptional regulator
VDSFASSAPLPGLRSAFQAIAAERAHERALALRRTRASLLTERESEVLALIASGLTNDEIADYLGLSSATVKSHIHGLLRRLGATTRAHAVGIAMRRGLIE